MQRPEMYRRWPFLLGVSIWFFSYMARRIAAEDITSSVGLWWNIDNEVILLAVMISGIVVSIKEKYYVCACATAVSAFVGSALTLTV